MNKADIEAAILRKAAARVDDLFICSNDYEEDIGDMLRKMADDIQAEAKEELT